MANFTTHVAVAAASSGAASTTALKAGLIAVPEALILTLLGIIGGVLPDIDLKYSHPSKIIFSFLGLLGGLLTVFSVTGQWSVVELWVLGGVVFFCVRYPLWYMFHRLTTHRGAIHSVVAGVFAGCASVVLSYHVLGHAAHLAWLVGIFVFWGFMIHLVLDEVYSVDFMNQRVKRSFGSALKLIDMDKRLNSAFIVFFALILSFCLPPLQAFLDILLTGRMDFYGEFLPHYMKTFFDALRDVFLL